MQDPDQVVVRDKGVTVLSQPANTLSEQSLIWVVKVDRGYDITAENPSLGSPYTARANHC